jgi:3-oxoadipate enol-lactonase
VAWARSGDVDLWYERGGEGPPLLYMSGTGGDLRRRPNVFDGPLPERFEVVAHDHRGQGRSGGPERPYTMEDYAEDAVAVLDAVGWPRAHVVGASFGGMVGQELAIRHPERVDRLVLCCTSSGGAGGASFPLHEVEGLPDDERLRMMLGVGDTRLGRAWQEAHPEETARLVELAGARGRYNPRQLDARRRHDTWDRLDRIAAPTLVAAGRYDGIAPVANAEALAGRIPGARLRVFEGGHLFLMEDPAALPAITEFLLGSPADPPS